jgi:hypothetical protein
MEIQDNATEISGHGIADASPVRTPSPICQEPCTSLTPPGHTASHDHANDTTGGSLVQTPSSVPPAPNHNDHTDSPAVPEVFIPRRGTRIRRPPAYLRDYVSHHEEDGDEEEAVTPGS